MPHAIIDAIDVPDVPDVPDVIDVLVGIEPGDRTDATRSARPEARAHAQGSFRALFEPQDPGTVTRAERYAVATFVAVLHGVDPVTDFYRTGLETIVGADSALGKAVVAEAERGLAAGPYGSYPAGGPLESQSVPGPEFAVDDHVEVYVLGTRLAAALNHAHFLVLHPRDADPARLQLLIESGWSVTDIVTLSQLVSFLSYQIRAVVGLTALKEAGTR